MIWGSKIHTPISYQKILEAISSSSNINPTSSKALKNHLKNLSSKEKITIHQALKPLIYKPKLYNKLTNSIITELQKIYQASRRHQSFQDYADRLNLDNCSNTQIIETLVKILNRKTQNSQKKCTIFWGEDHRLSLTGIHSATDFLLSNMDALIERANISEFGMELPSDINLEEVLSKPSEWKKAKALDYSLCKEIKKEVSLDLETLSKQLALGKSFSNIFKFRKYTLFPPHDKHQGSNINSKQKKNLGLFKSCELLRRKSKLPIIGIDIPMKKRIQYIAYKDIDKILNETLSILNEIYQSNNIIDNELRQRISQAANPALENLIQEFLNLKTLDQGYLINKINAFKEINIVKLHDLTVEREMIIAQNIKNAQAKTNGNFSVSVGRAHSIKLEGFSIFTKTDNAFRILLGSPEISPISVSIETLHKHITNYADGLFGKTKYLIDEGLELYAKDGKSRIIDTSYTDIKSNSNSAFGARIGDLFDAVIAWAIPKNDRPYKKKVIL